VSDGSAPGREPLSGADNAWRGMGQAENPTAITGMLAFDEPITYADARDRLEERLLRFDRFRQRPGGLKRRVGRPYWEDSPGFDVEAHLSHVALPEPQDQAAFERFVGGLMGQPLDQRRPLWHAYLVEGVGDGNALVMRINHSVADGFALLYVLLGLADDPASIDLPIGSVPEPPGADEVDATDAADTPADPPADPPADASGGDDPGVLSQVGGALRSAAGLPAAARTAYDLLTLDREADTSFRGELGTVKRAAWTDPIDLDRVKAVGDAHDATVNDVMLAATAGAFRRVLEERGESVDGPFRGSVPVNLKPLEERTESLGNYFGLLFVPLPVDEPDFEARIRVTNAWMADRTAGVAAFLVYLTFTVAGLVPDALRDWLLGEFEDQSTSVVTNVPGPTETFEFAGSEVSDVLFWAPEANDVGLSLSIFSYDGSIRVGVAADAGLLDDPAVLADALEAELDEQFAAS
jgi:diacylglycerol O-acyltransferase